MNHANELSVGVGVFYAIAGLTGVSLLLTALATAPLRRRAARARRAVDGIGQAVHDGVLTAAEADELRAKLRANVTWPDDTHKGAA